MKSPFVHKIFNTFTIVTSMQRGMFTKASRKSHKKEILWFCLFFEKCLTPIFPPKQSSGLPSLFSIDCRRSNDYMCRVSHLGVMVTLQMRERIVQYILVEKYTSFYV